MTMALLYFILLFLLNNSVVLVKVPRHQMFKMTANYEGERKLSSSHSGYDANISMKEYKAQKILGHDIRYHGRD